MKEIFLETAALLGEVAYELMGSSGKNIQFFLV